MSSRTPSSSRPSPQCMRWRRIVQMMTTINKLKQSVFKELKMHNSAMQDKRENSSQILKVGKFTKLLRNCAKLDRILAKSSLIDRLSLIAGLLKWRERGPIGVAHQIPRTIESRHLRGRVIIW